MSRKDIRLDKILINDDYNIEASYSEESPLGNEIKNKGRVFYAKPKNQLHQSIFDFLPFLRQTINDYADNNIKVFGVEIKKKDSIELGIIITAEKSIPKGLTLDIKTPLIAFSTMTETDFNKVQRMLDKLKSEFYDFVVLEQYDDNQLDLFRPERHREDYKTRMQEVADEGNLKISITDVNGVILNEFKPLNEAS